MKREVWKYEIGVGMQTLRLPHGAEILTAQTQGESIQLWALVDAEETGYDWRDIRVVGTGHSIYDCDEWKYISTVQMPTEAMGILVWHVFDAGLV